MPPETVEEVCGCRTSAKCPCQDWLTDSPFRFLDAAFPDRNCDIPSCDHDCEYVTNKTPLFIAAEIGHTRIVLYLLRNPRIRADHGRVKTFYSPSCQWMMVILRVIRLPCGELLRTGKRR